MDQPLHIFTAQDPPFDRFHLLYNNTSNLHPCHPDLYPIHVPLSIMHTHLFNNTLSNRLNNHPLYINISPNNSRNIKRLNKKLFTTLKMYSSLIRLKRIG